jgi:hypothetical protein
MAGRTNCAYSEKAMCQDVSAKVMARLDGVRKINEDNEDMLRESVCAKKEELLDMYR